MKPNILVFDCEAVQLHGPSFAVGAIVLDRSTHQVLDYFELLADEGVPLCVEWVWENVLPKLSDMPTCNTLKELRERFYQFYQGHKATADIYSDVNFPVETNFLSAIVADDPEKRQFEMPYPLFDIVNHVPLEVDRFAASGLADLRKHNPLDDAMASAICYLKLVGI